MNRELFVKKCNELGIEINDNILRQLEKYKELIQEWNNKFNLTTIIEDDEIYLKHFYDSMCIVKASELDNKMILDFGTGAGFPGIIIAVLFPNSNITLLESNNKKVEFLNVVKKELKLSNVNIICDRVENYGKNNREIYDIVTCRAVSNLSIILELSSSLLKINGLFIPLKSNVEEELEKAKLMINELSYKLINTIKYNLPIENSLRTILVFKKIQTTKNKYPRSYNIIKKSAK